MKYLFFLYLFSFCSFCFAQTVPDSNLAPVPLTADSVQARNDSQSRRLAFLRDSAQAAEKKRFQHLVDSSLYSQNPYFRFTGGVRLVSELRQWEGREGYFYGLVALLLYFGLIKSAFSRYLAELFRTYFRTTIRQRLIKEQNANTPLPSLLFNILFLFSGSMLVVLVLQHYRLMLEYPGWLLFLYSLLALALAYLVKFLSLKISGWLLGISDATDTYIFIVFTTNKVLGILLLLVLIGLAFTGGTIYQVFFTLGLVLVGVLMAYRYYLSYISIHKLVHINLFHFFIYLLALEIVPLLLINKVLVQFFTGTR